MQVQRDQLKSSLKVLFLILYYIFIVCFIFADIIMYTAGAYNVAVFKYGGIFPCLLVLLGITALFLPVMLRKASGAVTICLLLVCAFSYIFIPSRFTVNARSCYSSFSYEDWVSNPVVRSVMYEDLENESSSGYIIGKSAEEISVILGTPDYVSEDAITYETDPGTIRINFEDNAAVNVEWR